MTPEPRRLGSEGASEPESPQEPGSPAEQDASPQDAQADEHSSAPAQAPGRAKGAKRARSFWRDLVIIVFAALVLTILLKTFVTQVFAIPTGSMENTLQPGDRVLVNKLVYRFRDIARGDVVVFSGQGSWGPDAPPPPGNPLVRLWDEVTNLVGVSAPGTDYIKRVIGLPGDHVMCCDAQGRVTVNGVPLSEQSYVHPGDAPSQIPFSVTVPPGRLWVLGDNRANSDDSRYRRYDPGSGTIPESAVVGRAFVIIWPPSRIGDLPIPATFGQAGLHAAAAVAAAAPAVGGSGSVALAVGAVAWYRQRNRRTGPDKRPG
jgi:signal peptidase I